MRAGLVGQDVRHHLAFDHALQQIDGVGHDTDRLGDACGLPRQCLVDGRIDVLQHQVAVARVETLLDARRIDLGGEASRAVHRRREGLGAAHPTETRRDDQAAVEAPAEVPLGGGGEGLVGALQDSLAADVDPRAGRHLPEHHLALGLEVPEVLPVGPVPHQVRIGDQDAWRGAAGLEDADRPTGLHQQRLVRFETLQGGDDRLEAGPIARGLAAAAIHDQLLGFLRYLGVQVVEQEPQRGFRLPGLRGQLRATRCSLGADRNGVVRRLACA